MFTFAAMKVWKQFISILLLVGIFSNCFNYWLLASSYAFNKSYISSVLCTNRDQPDLHCEGKCFMDIKLKELEQKNKSEQSQLKRMIETVAPIAGVILAPVFEVAAAQPSTHYVQQKPTTTVIEIFQPPKQS